MRRLWYIVVVAWLFPLGVRANLSGEPLLSEEFAPGGAAIVEIPQADRPRGELASATPLITAADPADRLAPFFVDEWSDIFGPAALDDNRLSTLVDPSMTAGDAIWQIPPAPSSARLLLSAVISAGVWHLVRASVRHVRSGVLPEWYHTGGPTQIGHAVPVEPGFGVPLPCWFESLAGGTGDCPDLRRFRRDPCSHSGVQGFLALLAPRAPPALHAH